MLCLRRFQLPTSTYRTYHLLSQSILTEIRSSVRSDMDGNLPQPISLLLLRAVGLARSNSVGRIIGSAQILSKQPDYSFLRAARSSNPIFTWMVKLNLGSFTFSRAACSLQSQILTKHHRVNPVPARALMESHVSANIELPNLRVECRNPYRFHPLQSNQISHPPFKMTAAWKAAGLTYEPLT